MPDPSSSKPSQSDDDLSDPFSSKPSQSVGDMHGSTSRNGNGDNLNASSDVEAGPSTASAQGSSPACPLKLPAVKCRGRPPKRTLQRQKQKKQLCRAAQSHTSTCLENPNTEVGNRFITRGLFVYVLFWPDSDSNVVLYF